MYLNVSCRLFREEIGYSLEKMAFIFYFFIYLFFPYTIYTFSNKKFTVTRYLYIWTCLGSQSKSHYKIVHRTAGCVKFRGDLCKLFDWETFINKQKG